jgi:hypothetical protein
MVYQPILLGTEASHVQVHAYLPLLSTNLICQVNDAKSRPWYGMMPASAWNENTHFFIPCPVYFLVFLVFVSLGTCSISRERASISSASPCTHAVLCILHGANTLWGERD